MPAVLKKYMDEYTKFYAPDRAKEKTAAEKIFAEQEKVANDAYSKAVKDTKISYEDQHRENAIQKLINENEVAEDMANMGHNDSGLNRTQQTAVQLSYANNRSSINRQKQAQLDTFAQNLAAELSSIRQNRISTIADIDKEYDSAVASSAQAAYKTYQDAETDRIKENNRHIEKMANNQTDNFILNWNGLTKFNDSGETINIYTDSSGKKYEAKVGYNPYTSQNNKNSASGKYGFFKNSYQPKGIVDIDGTDYGELDNTYIPSYLTGKKQNIWKTDKSGREQFWLWSGVENAYVELIYNPKNDTYDVTDHKVYI